MSSICSNFIVEQSSDTNTILTGVRREPSGTYRAEAGIQSKSCYLGCYDTAYKAAIMVAKAKFLYKSK